MKDFFRGPKNLQVRDSIELVGGLFDGAIGFISRIDPIHGPVMAVVGETMTRVCPTTGLVFTDILGMMIEPTQRWRYTSTEKLIEVETIKQRGAAVG